MSINIALQSENDGLRKENKKLRHKVAELEIEVRELKRTILFATADKKEVVMLDFEQNI